MITAAEDELLTEVAAQMVTRGLTRLPTGRDSVPAGMMTRHDLLPAMVRDEARG